MHFTLESTAIGKKLEIVDEQVVTCQREGRPFPRITSDKLRQLNCQRDEVLDAEAFGAEVEYGVGDECLMAGMGRYGAVPAFPFRFGADKRFQGVPESLSALIESRFYNSLEESLVATEVGAGIAAEADYGRLYFRRGSKGSGPDSKQVFDIIPSLQQHRKNAVSLGARFFGYTFGDLFLDHADYFRYPLFMVQNLEENLGGDIVREVADYGERLRKYLFEPKFKEIRLHQSSLHASEMGEEIVNGFSVYLDKMEVNILSF